MKRRVLSYVISAFACAFATATRAEHPAASESAVQQYLYPPRTYSFQPCSSWSYNSMGNGFVCNFTSPTISVTDARDVAVMARTIEDLKAQVADLTRRIEALESH